MARLVPDAEIWNEAMTGPVEGLNRAVLVDVARATLAARRALEQALPPELIPDPVLDLLLALFTLAEPGEPVDNEILTGVTTVAKAVVGRYLRALDGYGFVAYDETANISALTPTGIERVADALREIVRSQARLLGERSNRSSET